jgi:hypothetical protein
LHSHMQSNALPVPAQCMRRVVRCLCVVDHAEAWRAAYKLVPYRDGEPVLLSLFLSLGLRVLGVTRRLVLY